MYGFVANNQDRYEQFIDQIIRNGKVWGLKIDGEWVVKPCLGSFYDDSGEPINQELVPFWMQKNLAEYAKDKAWQNASVVSISLNDFLENECMQFHQKNTLVGTNLNANFVGSEIKPLDLIFDILEKMKVAGKSLFAENKQQPSFISKEKRVI